MKRLVFIIGITLVLGALAVPVQAIRAVPADGSGGEGKGTSSSETRRVFVFVEKLDEHGLYSEDGTYYRFGSDTRVLRQERRDQSRRRMAELVFEGKSLKWVVLR